MMPPEKYLMSHMCEVEIQKLDNFVDIVIERARLTPNKESFVWLDNGETKGKALTFLNMSRRAKGIGAFLESKMCQHRTLLMLYPLENVDFFEAFLGVLFSGSVAVPCFPPDPTRLKRTMARFLAIIEDAKSTLVLTNTLMLGLLRPVIASIPEFAKMNISWITTDDIKTDEWEPRWIRPAVSADTVAFLQYTSGSTGIPKGVMVSHGNLVSDIEAIAFTYRYKMEMSLLVWLPLYHDMGLIGNALAPIYIGATGYYFAPTDFLKKPSRWLQAIHNFRCNLGGGPNFGFELAVRKTTPEQRDKLDLSCLDVMYSASEPIHPKIVESFFDFFGPAKIRRSTFTPGYGLAESTLMVTSHTPGVEPTMLMLDADLLAHNRAEVIYYPPLGHKNVKYLMSSGVAVPNQVVKIVGHHHHNNNDNKNNNNNNKNNNNNNKPSPCPSPSCPSVFVELGDGQIGEIWVAGPCVAQGYWGRDEATTETFHAFLENGQGPFLRTGDLGFFCKKELFVCGRVKDLIILSGKNVYPQDIESTAEGAHPMMRPGCSACFSVEERACADGTDSRGGGGTGGRLPGAGCVSGGGCKEWEEERVCLVGELRQAPASADEEAQIFRAVVDAVSVYNEVGLAHVVLIKERSILKTTSGKIQRRATKQAFLSNELEVYARWSSGKYGFPTTDSSLSFPSSSSSVQGSSSSSSSFSSSSSSSSSFPSQTASSSSLFEPRSRFPSSDTLPSSNTDTDGK